MEHPSRILTVLKYLYDVTDAEHDISSKDIMRMLEEQGFSSPDRRTIETDVDMLIAAGHDIQKEHRSGVPTRYRVIGRDFDTVELKILIDAVAASQFIGAERSQQLIQKLAAMASLSDRAGLLGVTDCLLSIKSAIPRNIYVADDLYRAIVARKKIQYEMLDFSVPDKQPVPHRDGYVYTVSPYAMVWNHDRYYLIAHEEERDCILTPRIDHIQNVRLLDLPIRPMPENFDIGCYYSLNYKMYAGPESEVTLLCENDLISHVMDHFGTGFACVPVSDHTFRATGRTAIGPTFFGWLFQYAGKMSLEGPKEVVDAYNKHRKKAARGPRAEA